jgi:hypothetical protein
MSIKSIVRFRKGVSIAGALAVLISGISLVVARPAEAANCASTYWPHTGDIDTNHASDGTYSAMLRFTLTSDEVCSLQALNRYLEMDFALNGFATDASWDSYNLSTNLPGGIKDTSAGDPANEATPAVTGVDTSKLQANVTYYAAVSWNAPVIVDTEQAVLFRWIPSYWAESTAEASYCSVGIVNNNLAWCYFPNKEKTVEMFGPGGFTNGFPSGHVPLRISSYSWAPDSTGRPVITENILSVPTPVPVNTPPVARFDFTRFNGPNNTVSLNGMSSYDSDGSIATWTWYKDGNIIATGPAPTVDLGNGVTHSDITLTVTDNRGASTNITKNVSTPNRRPTITSVSPENGGIAGSNTPTLSVNATDPDGDKLSYSFQITTPRETVKSPMLSNYSTWKVPATKLDPGTKYTWKVTVDDRKTSSVVSTNSFTVAMLPTASELVSMSTGAGYWEVAGDGGVFAYGAAQFYGSVPGVGVSVNNIIGMARTPSDKGYWVVGKDGGVFAFGDARFYGSLPGLNIHVGNIVGMAPTKDGLGYWLVGSDGGVFAFGNAGFFGSMGGKPLNKPVQAIAPTATSQGYWLAAEDGGVFAFGDAPFLGSMGGQPLNYPVVDIDATPDGRGYWLTAEDGGVFAYGNAGFYGSLAGQPLNGHINSMAITPDGKGYWLNGCDGGIFAFGNAPFYGSQPRYGCRGISY